MKKIFKRMLPVLCIIPFIIGTIGYLLAGERVTDSLYASVTLYLTSPVSDAYNYWIDVARWTAPLVTAVTILCAIQKVWNAVYCRVVCLLGGKDSVAVYTDYDCKILFDKGTRVIYPEENFKEYAKSHIIMFSSDEKNMQFYEEHKDNLREKDVYISVKELELGLLGNIEDVNLFDINNSIARLLWKKIAVWNRNQETMNIVIFGNNSLAGAIVSSGLQLNLFSFNQQLNYFFVTDNRHFQTRHKNMKLMNKDKLYYYSSDDMEIWDNVLINADIVIVADILECELLQTIVATVRDKKIYYYSPKEGDVASYFSFGRLVPFGRMEEVFTDKNIRQKNLIQKAIALNESYAEKYHTQKNWNKLTGFLKASNISAADFGEVLLALSDIKSKKELAKLEHIRWCRFYYLNYYIYGIPENGKSKDDCKRIHKDLVSYKQLDEVEKIKDIEAVETVKNLLQ